MRSRGWVMGVAQDAPSRGYVSSPGALVSLAALMVRVPADFPMMLPSMALLHPNRLLSITGQLARNQDSATAPPSTPLFLVSQELAACRQEAEVKRNLD